MGWLVVLGFALPIAVALLADRGLKRGLISKN
jgi:hypothetical protein